MLTSYGQAQSFFNILLNGVLESTKRKETKMETFNNILVVSRSTKHCLKAVRTGISLARKFRAKLYILHVIDDPFNLEGWNLPVPTFQDEYRKMIADAKRELDQMVQAEKADGLIVSEWVKEGEPVDEIQKVVESEHIDLIIMLAHSEGRLEHFLFGKTNAAIIRKLPATLMLVKKEV
jgi:nucleotide-binding universal stress UspA family protein